jgi:Skp family chaperone for outer membrane proteins
MKKFIALVTTAFLMLGLSTAHATALKIGVVDLPQIMQKSPQVAAINQKLQTQFGPQQQKIIAMQNNILNSPTLIRKKSKINWLLNKNNYNKA